MDAVEFEIVSVVLQESLKYKLVFQDSVETEVSAQVTSKPHFEPKKYLVPVKDTPKGGSGLEVAVFGEKDGVQQKLGERTFFLASSAQRHSHKLLFYPDDTSSVDGTITIEYRFTKFPVTHALRGDRVYCVSVQAAHLNTLVETPFSLSLSACLLDDVEPISPVVHLTNQESHGHMNLVDLYDSLSTRGIDIVIVDEVTSRRYKVTVAPLSPMVVSIPMNVGDPLVLTLQCMYTMEVGRQMVTGLVHTSYMREAAIIHTPGSTARKISLSPRRTTTFDQSAAAVGLLGTGQAIPSTKKTLLFLEDSQLNVRTTPNSAIIGGVQCAEQIDAQGNVILTRPVENFHEAYLSDIAARTHGEGQKHRHIGPATGAYVVCNSKSEVLDTEVNKKTHKKQTLTVNLGTLQVAQSCLTGPVKIRAKLVDLVFSPVGERVNLLGNVASEGKHQQKAVIAYVGLLEEASRELFNDTGLVACTLEGKLFKPAPNAATAAASAVRDGSVASAHGGEEGEDLCIAVKLYITLVPAREEAASEHSDSENSENEGEGKLNPRSGKSSRRPSRRASVGEGSTSRRVSFSGGGAEPNAATGTAPEAGPEPGASRDASAAKLGVDDGGVSPDVQRRIDANEPYNVVDKRNALPDELHGSSSLLAVPSHHASQRSSAAELKAMSKSRSNVTVPPLPIGGSAAGSNAASAASLYGHISAEESRFVSLHPSKSALSAAGSVGGSVAHSFSAESLLDTEPSLGRKHKGAFGESLEPTALARVAGDGRQQPHNPAAVGVAFAEAIRGELAQKQRTIDELTEDLRLRNEAIQVCGFDIRNLREETIRLNNRIAAMEADKVAKVEAERKADEVTSEVLKYPNLLSEMDKPTLVRNVHRLRERVLGLDKDKAALEAALRKATDVISECAALKKEHTILQAAHVEQTKYLQKMQGKIAQISAYQETIKNQEKIITKMQTIVESKLRAKNALPFQTKPNTQIPVPQVDPFALPPSLPDFEAIQAQKLNEEALLQARLEIEELNEKVRDLEHQLYEAKLAQYDQGADESHSEAGSEEDRLEREAPSSSVLQELTDEERAKFEDLQVANTRIDELEAENTSKAYRINALEQQLEVSTRDYSREIARLRTKLFELEITAAMADDRPGSGAGEEDFMEMDLDALLQIPEPGAPKSVHRSHSGDLDEHSQSGKQFAPRSAGSDAQRRGSTSRGSDGGGAKSAVPVTPPGAPSADGPVRMNSFLRSPTASGAASTTTSAKLAPVAVPDAPTGAAADEKLQAGHGSLEAEKGDSGLTARTSRPASGSARAAALSIKSNPDFAETAGGAKKRKLSARGASGEVGPTTDSLDRLVLSTEGPIGTGSKAPSPKGAVAADNIDASKPDPQDPAHSKAGDITKPDDSATTPVGEGQHTASAENLSLGPSPPESIGPSRTSPQPSEKPSVQTHPVSEHPPNEGEPLVRVPKFRKKSMDSGAPRLGIGAQGPIDPDALEKTVDLTMEIIDADQVSPRSEATVRTKKDNKIVLAMLTVTVHCFHDHIRKATTFKILKLKLHGYSQELLQNRFDPYLKLSVGSKWSCVTGHVKTSGMTALWEFDPEHGFFDKKFTLTDEDMESPSNTLLVCVVKKKNERAREDFECGTGTLVLSKSVFD